MLKVALFFFIQLAFCAQGNEYWSEAPSILLYTFRDGTVSTIQHELYDKYTLINVILYRKMPIFRRSLEIFIERCANMSDRK